MKDDHIAGLNPERMELRRDGVTRLYIHMIHIFNIFPARLWINCIKFKADIGPWIKAQESSSHCYSLRERE